MSFPDIEFLSLDELFDISKLQELQDSFSELTGLASVITLLDGTPITQSSNFCDVCKIIRSTDKGFVNCIKSDTHIAQMSLNMKSGHVQPCLSAGLLDAGVSINVGGVHVGNWMIGQVRNSDIDLNGILEYAKAIGADENLILEAYDKVTVMSTEKLKTATTLLQSIVSNLSENAFNKYLLNVEKNKNDELNKKITQTETLSLSRINNINHGIIICTPDGTITFHNSAVNYIFRTLSVKGKTVNSLKFELYNKTGEKLDITNYPVHIIASSLMPVKNEIYGVSIDNNDTMWVKLNGAPILDNDNQICEIIFSIEDITTEKISNDNFIKTIQFLENTQNIAAIGTFTCKPLEGKWYGSKILFDILGIENQRIRHTSDWKEIIHPNHKTEYIELFSQAVFNKKSTFFHTYKIIRQNDLQERWIKENSSVTLNPYGEPELVIGTLQDITDIKNAEETAKQNEEKYKLLLENVLDVYYKVDMNFIICEVSPSLKHYIDVEPEEVIGQKFDKFFITSHSENEFVKAILGKRKIHDYLIDIKLDNKGIIPVSISASLTCDKNGEPKYIEGFIRDMTERKQMENLLLESITKFKKYIEFSPYAIIVSDNNNKFIEVNPSTTRISGYNAEELLSKKMRDLITTDYQEHFSQHWKKATTYGLASDELAIITKTCEKKHVLIDTIKSNDQQFITFLSDTSYHHKIEAKLRQKQEYLEDAQQIARVGNAIIDFKTKKWKGSATLYEIIGINKNDECVIEDWLKIIHPEALEELRVYFLNEVLPKQLTIDKEFKIIRQNDSETRWLHVIGKPVFNSENRIETLTFTLQDITERKEWTDKLYHNEALYRTTLNASPDTIVVVDLSGKVRMVSPVAKQLYGSDNIDSILGRDITEFIAPEDHAKLLSNFSLMFSGYLGTVEYRMKRANGEVFLAEVNGDVIRNSNGEPLSLAFIIRDITQRKQAEEALANSKEQLKEFAGHLQSIREEEKIALAREIHDDLGQMLVAMKIDIGMLKKRLSNTDHGLSTDFLHNEMSKMLDSTNKTIAIARRIMSDLRSDNVNNLGFFDAAKMYIENFNERFKIDCRLENEVGNLEFSQQQTVALYRILQESLNNIAKHAKASRVNIKLKKTEQKLCMHIIDNGCGFDTERPRRNDSYGLLGMKERVTLLDGNINIKSAIGKGTTISIEIPVDKN